MSHAQLVGNATQWRHGRDVDDETRDVVVTVNNDSFFETGNIELGFEMRDRMIYLRVDPEALMVAVLRARTKE